MKKVFLFLTVLAVIVTLFTGCAELGINSQTSDTGFGTIQVRVTDAPPDYDIQGVSVYFSEVSVHKAGDGSGESEEDGEWIDIEYVDHEPIDLATLGKGIDELLANDEYVPVGKYTQIRVIVDESEGKGVQVTYSKVGEEGTKTVQAELPSGELKFVHPFYVVDSTTTIITLDFVLEDSVNFTGATKNGDPKVIVKPVVKLVVEQQKLVGTISGNVTEFGTDPAVAISGATITVDGAGLTATTDGNGDYTIPDVPVGAGSATYTVTASADGYVPSSQADIEVKADSTTTVNFALEKKIDLTLSPEDITYNSPSSTLEAIIHNVGGIDLSDVVVRFYDGDPGSGGMQIDSDQIIDIPALGTAITSVSWTPTSGSYDIYVVVDPGDLITEYDETNNQAFNTISVASPSS